MTDFEGINPYEYQKAAVAFQKKNIAGQPHLRPQIEKAKALKLVIKPRVEAPKMVRGGVDIKAGAGLAGAVGGIMVSEAIGAIGFIAKETVKTIVTESIPGATRREKPRLQRFFEQPAPIRPRYEAGKKQAVRNELNNLVRAEVNADIRTVKTQLKAA